MLEGQIDTIGIQNTKVSAEKRRAEGHHRQIRNMFTEEAYLSSSGNQCIHKKELK
jgi:hypothetical protein